MTRVLVCGGRDFGVVPRDLVKAPWGEHAREQARQQIALLDETLSSMPRPTVLIYGAATGADEHARQWARRNGVPLEPYPANWFPNGRASGRLDRSQGPIRNQRMIDEGKPDLVIAFPGRNGTADLVRRARAAGIEVREVTPGSQQQEDEK